MTCPDILDGSTPGYFDTNNEGKPWAQIALAGDSDISGIVLLNRYIRIERQIVDKTKPPRQHFRNFLVYGRKLY